MKSFPTPQTNWGELYSRIMIGAQSDILIKAIEWKIFDYLGSKITAPEVAAKMQSHPRNTELFLNALAGMDIIAKKNGYFFNTKTGEEFLVSQSPTYMGAFFLHVTEWGQKLVPNLEQFVMQGPIKMNDHNMTSDDMWAESARLSAVYQFSGEAQHIAHIVAQWPEFPKMRKMLDLGGGAGFFTMAIVASHPNMQGIVFEQPMVAEVAKDFIKQQEMEDRVSTLAGNYLTDSFQGKYDLIFASATLNFHKQNMEALFSKIYNALNPGGIFMTHQDGFTHERTKPASHTCGFMFTEMMGMDFALQQGEIANQMIQAGFRSVRSFTRSSAAGDMDIDIARK